MTEKRRTTVADRHEQRLLAAFVGEAGQLPLVREIWIESGEAIDATVVVHERDDLSELRLFSMFHTLSHSRTRPRCGDLAVVTEPYASSSATRHLVRS